MADDQHSCGFYVVLEVSLNSFTVSNMNRYEMVLSSSIEECRKLHDFLSVMAEIEGFSEPFALELELVIKEAFVNAVQHGNAHVQGAVVRLHFKLAIEDGVRTLFVEICDSGPGFSVYEIADPTVPEMLMQPSGRGVFFIRSYADIVRQECDDEGCRLLLRMMPY